MAELAHGGGGPRRPCGRGSRPCGCRGCGRWSGSPGGGGAPPHWRRGLPGPTGSETGPPAPHSAACDSAIPRFLPLLCKPQHGNYMFGAGPKGWVDQVPERLFQLLFEAWLTGGCRRAGCCAGRHRRRSRRLAERQPWTCTGPCPSPALSLAATSPGNQHML